MKKTLIAILTLLVVCLSFTGCGQKEEVNNEITENITREEKKTDKAPEKKEEKKAEKADEKQETKEPKEKGEPEKKEEPAEEENPQEELPAGEKAPAAEPVPQEPAVIPQAPSAKVNLNSVKDEIKTAVSAKGAMDLGSDAISNLYGISPADISQAAGFVVMEGTFPHEAVMVEAKDSAAADNVERLLKAKHTAFTEQSKGYDAENYELATKCRVERKGNHISMFLTPDFEAMRSVYSKYVK